MADAKYIPLAQKRSLPIEQAESVYYKTIMYMLRFNAKQAFLFYPFTENEIHETKDDTDEDEQYRNFTEDKCLLIEDYQILDTQCVLHKVGIKISKTESYAKFIDSMQDVEDSLKNYLSEKCTNKQN